MTIPNLLAQARLLASNLTSALGLFPISDPRRDWLATELESLRRLVDADDLSLEEAHAVSSGLHQLDFLVQRHADEANRVAAEDFWELPVSYRTAQARLPSNVVEAARRYRCTIDPALLHDPNQDNLDFDPVSPTAKIVAYLRSLDDCDDIHGSFGMEEEGRQLLDRFGLDDDNARDRLATLFLARYHTINAVMTQSAQPQNQVIEFAAGISPRGYQWSRAVANSVYVESDLPSLMVRKAKMIRDQCIDRGVVHRGIHHCCGVDVLDRYSFAKAVRHVDTQLPFTIVTEGLLLYFDETEMHRFFAIISGVLREFPHATWITDFVTQADFRSLFENAPDVAAIVKRVFSDVGRHVVKRNPFLTEDSVESFLSEYGLKLDVQLHLRHIANSLSFLKSVPNRDRETILGQRKIWKLRSA